MTDESAAPVLQLLIDALGDRVDTDPAALDVARADKSGHRSSAPPIAVVHAESVDDVQAVMRIATQTRTPVVTRGAGTGLAGAANAGAGEIALSMLRMRDILEINPEDQLAVVQPGILNAELNDVLATHGLWWAPDPASREIASVGGNIGAGAGGLLCAKYGVTREAVLGVDLVLADGRLMKLGHRSVKGVTGLDLTALVVGSEGRLGVVVAATLKLRRLVPGEVVTVASWFGSAADAARAASAVTAAGIQPSIMELVDARSLVASHDLLDLPAPPPGAAHLLVQTDGPGARVEAEAVVAVLKAVGGVVEIADDPVEAANLLRVRRSMHPAMERLGTTLIEDVSVPRSAMPAMFEEIARIELEHGVIIPTVAHAGDGNLHPNFIFEGEVVPEHIWTAADALFLAALRLGGTLTGEHGIGLLKRRWLADELGDDQVQLQRDIAAVFDPLNILNPGKVF